MAVLGTFGVTAIMSRLSGKAARITFDHPPGHITITELSPAILMPWHRVERRRHVITQDDAHRASVETVHQTLLTRVSETAAVRTETVYYKVNVPTGVGSTVQLYDGQDRETAERIRRRLSR